MDANEYRQIANGIGKAAAGLTEVAFGDGRDFEALTHDLATMRDAAEICRRLARKDEARRALSDANAPLCLGCKHRTDGGEGLACGKAMDVRAATTKRNCSRYEAES